MKKILLIMPLMALSLFSCGNKTDDSIVNEKEMYDAITLKGVEYLQFNAYKDDKPTLPERNEISPNRCHRIIENEKSYTEYYLFRENETTIKEWKTTEKGVPVKEVTYEHDLFPTIKMLKEELLGPFVDKKYEDFEYQKDAKEYIVHFEDELSDKYISAIKFSKKKVIEFTTWLESADREHFTAKAKFEYEEVIPIPPGQ